MSGMVECQIVFEWPSVLGNDDKLIETISDIVEQKRVYIKARKVGGTSPQRNERFHNLDDVQENE